MRRAMGPIDDAKREIWFRESAARTRALEVVRLMVYTEGENGFPAEENKKTLSEMHAELMKLSGELRDCMIARCRIERAEREATEAVTTKS